MRDVYTHTGICCVCMHAYIHISIQSGKLSRNRIRRKGKQKYYLKKETHHHGDHWSQWVEKYEVWPAYLKNPTTNNILALMVVLQMISPLPKWALTPFSAPGYLPTITGVPSESATSSGSHPNPLLVLKASPPPFTAQVLQTSLSLWALTTSTHCSFSSSTLSAVERLCIFSTNRQLIHYVNWFKKQTMNKQIHENYNFKNFFIFVQEKSLKFTELNVILVEMEWLIWYISSNIKSLAAGFLDDFEATSMGDRVSSSIIFYGSGSNCEIRGKGVASSAFSCKN